MLNMISASSQCFYKSLLPKTSGEGLSYYRRCLMYLSHAVFLGTVLMDTFYFFQSRNDYLKVELQIILVESGITDD